PLAQRAGVNVVAFSTAEQLADGSTFLLGFLARQNVDRITSFAHERGAARFAALAPSTPYGEVVVAAFRDAVLASGATLDQVEYYDPAAHDLRGVVRRLTNAEARQAALARERKQLEAQGDEASQLALRRLAGRTSTGDAGFDAVLIPEGGAKLKAVAS